MTTRPGSPSQPAQTMASRRRELLVKLYGFDFPEDFHNFFAACRAEKPLEPLRALEDNLGLRLVGPFEVLAGRFDTVSPPAPMVLQARRRSDLPEFFTVLEEIDGGRRIGYFLDDPDRGGPLAVAVADTESGPGIQIEANALAWVLRLWLEEAVAEMEGDPELVGDDQASVFRASLEALRAPLDRLLNRAGLPAVPLTGQAFIESMPEQHERDALIGLATQDGSGVVAPFEVCQTRMDPRRVQEAIWRTKGLAWLMRKADSALCRGQAGVALAIGREMWSTGTRKRRGMAAAILEKAYLALGRHSLARVVQADRAYPDREWRDVAQAP
ncbi:MAG: DUF2228 domain-containing protein [Planctomycetota bacterium]|nr:MAG: DUF2228 domain-containing protein [Planctomycetota bacterium]